MTFTIGVLFKEQGFYGWLPIIASTFYAFVMLVTDNINKLKLGLIVNNILWLFYEIIILDFVGVLFKVFSLISCTQMVIKERKSKNEKEN